MKSMFKPALVACMALAIGLVGCQNEPVVDGPEKKGTKSMVIKMSQLGSRAVVDAATEDDLGTDENEGAVTFNKGALYFTDGTDVLRRIMVITDAALTERLDADPDAVLGADEVTIEDLKDVEGHLFTNLPATVEQVYFLGNSPEGYTGNAAVNNVGYNFSTVTGIKTAQIKLASQATFSNIAIYGEDTDLEDTTNTDNDIIEADIEAKVIAARFEIGSIAAATEGDVKYPAITSFVVDAIYIDNIYMTAQFAGLAVGTVIGGPEDGYVAWEDEYADNYGDTRVEDIDMDTVGGDAAASFVADEDDEDKVWGYNLLAPYTMQAVQGGDPVKAQAELPYVVIKISNITLEGDVEWDGPKFLTLEQKVATGGTAKTLDQGKIYKIDDVVFNASDLTDYPYAGTIDVEVFVDILPWTVDTVPYDFW